jgi:hypothetical protein
MNVERGVMPAAKDAEHVRTDEDTDRPRALRTTRGSAPEAGRDQESWLKAIPVPRVALRVPEEAATALGVSADFFDMHVRPDLKLVRRGRLVLVSVSELERWARDNGTKAFA